MIQHFSRARYYIHADYHEGTLASTTSRVAIRSSLRGSTGGRVGYLSKGKKSSRPDPLAALISWWNLWLQLEEVLS